MKKCPICTKNHLHQDGEAKMVICPDCERMVCEDCMTEVQEVSPSAIPDTAPLNSHGVSLLCLECAGV